MNKDCVAREITREMVVGAFVLMIFLGIGYFTIILSTDPWMGPKSEVSVQFEDVRGLREGDNVVVRGVTVGRVAKASLEPDGVRVQLRMHERFDFHEGYAIQVVPSSILGGTHVRISPGDGERVPHGSILHGDAPKDLMETAAAVIEELREELIDGQLLGSLASASASLSNLFKRVESGEGTLGKLFSEDASVYDDLAATVSDLKTITARIVAGEGTMGRLLSDDDTLYEDLSESAAALRTLAQRIEEGKGTVGRLLSEDETMYEDLKASIASLRQITSDAADGKGSLGKLLQDDTLYENINAASDDLRAITTDIREQKGLVGKLISDEKMAEQVEATLNEIQAMLDDLRDTSPLVTFTSVFFGAF